MSTWLERMTTDFLLEEVRLMSEYEARALAQGDTFSAAESADERALITRILLSRGIDPDLVHHVVTATRVDDQVVIARGTVTSAAPAEHTQYAEHVDGSIYGVVWTLPGGTIADRDLLADYVETRWGETLREILMIEVLGLDACGQVSDTLYRIKQDIATAWGCITDRHLDGVFGSCGATDDF